MSKTRVSTLAKNRFNNLDLNLLRVFKILLEEKNMRKAAERLFVSQPAVSQSLQKLRHHFDDLLFVKVKTGLEPTTFSEQLARDLLPLLHQLESVVNSSSEFDPAELDGEVTIALSSQFVFSVSGEIYRYFSNTAPNLTVHITSWNEHTIEGIEKGDILLGVNAPITESLPFLVEQQLTQLTAKLLVRHDHPIASQPITAENLSPYPLARLLVSDYSKLTSPTVEAFKRLGFELEVGFASEFPLVLIDVLRHSDMFMGINDSFPIQDYPDLAMLEPDIHVPEAHYPANGYFHSRHVNSDMMNWFTRSLADIFERSKQH
ncbi:LysR family transcriptional regulator [Vibrio variabilis]|uniref:LysR family transcriptional regulator n=1 Tax=Vibrio variabilis TaxID=990271 RepID=UPI0013A69F8C|nr:LysR family transcriptional regulator [Vibrio variabilis]